MDTFTLSCLGKLILLTDTYTNLTEDIKLITRFASDKSKPPNTDNVIKMNKTLTMLFLHDNITTEEYLCLTDIIFELRDNMYKQQLINIFNKLKTHLTLDELSYLNNFRNTFKPYRYGEDIANIDYKLLELHKNIITTSEYTLLHNILYEKVQKNDFLNMFFYN